MNSDQIIMEVALIFAGASVFSTIFIFFKQPVILAYIAWGIVAGPYATGLVKSPENIEKLSHFGIILLMFLLGLHLPPNKLWKLFRSSSIVTISTSLFFAFLTMVLLLFFDFAIFDAIIAGSAMMFSSTVISLKLCPTTTLHQQHQGDLMTSILLFQDIIAVILILMVTGSGSGGIVSGTLFLIAKLAFFFTLTLLTVKYVLIKLFIKYDVIQEYIFLMAIGWCLFTAEVGQLIGLSHEIGGFIGGVSIATSPVALFIAEELKPLREFFLILFFFSIGAQFDFLISHKVIIPSVILAVSLCFIKPLAYKYGFRKIKEPEKTAKSVGLRLGQCSEFALLLSYAAMSSQKIAKNTGYLIQLTTIITFVISTYLVVYKLPTPISSKKEMRKD